MARIYLSSTFSDLQAEREAVYNALRRLRHDVLAMEDYVAADRRPLEKCLEDVRKCDIYVGIFGWRYGFVPPGEEKSITELEFREAEKSGKTCLIFLQEERSRPQDVPKQVEGLREELCLGRTVSFFRSPEDLAARATAAVANVFGELSEAIGDLDMPLSQVLEAVRHIAETPRLSPRQIEQEVQHLQADAMEWVSRDDGLTSAQLRLNEARRLTADGIRREPQNADILALLGYIEKTQWQVSEKSGDMERANDSLTLAARYFRAALEIEPSNISALNGRVNIYLANRDYDHAAATGRLVTAMYPGYTAAFWDLGIALQEKLKREGTNLALAEELAAVYETLVHLIPGEPGGFTPADHAYAQDKAREFATLKSKLQNHKANESGTHTRKPRK